MLLTLLFSMLTLLSNHDDITMVFAGDAMQHGPQIRNATRENGKIDYSPCFTHIENLVKGADFAAVNLECTLSGKPYTGYPSFSAPAEFALSLQGTGFDLMSVANNHILDKGDRGVVSTLDTLKSIGIPSIGAYRNKAERDTVSPYIATVKGSRIAFIAATYGTNLGGTGKGAVVDRINREILSKDIKEAEDKSDFTVVMLHWGNEYQQKPNKSQKELAKFIADSGADLIIGSHPHVVQPLDSVISSDGRIVPVAYSLGNFISNQNDKPTRGGAIAHITLTRNSDNKIAIKEASYSYVFVQKPLYGKGSYQLIPTDSVQLLQPHSMNDYNGFMESISR